MYLEVRVNSRKNLLAVETRNGLATRALLKLTSVCAIPVRAYEPRSSHISTGTNHFFETELSGEALLESVTSVVAIRADRRLKFTRLASLNTYIISPVQCRRCGVVGHVLTVCHHRAS